MANTTFIAFSFRRYTTLILVSLLGFSLLCCVFVTLHYQINWDEFLFLSNIYRSKSGDLPTLLQTAYVYPFYWLTVVPGDEIDQIVVGRVVMLAFQFGTMWFLFCIAKDLIGINASLFALLAYSTFSYVTIHGASFRADPIIGLLLAMVYFLILKRDPDIKTIIAVSILVSLAVAVSIKAFLFMPIIMLIAMVRMLRNKTENTLLIRYMILGVTTILFFIVILFIHGNLSGGESISTVTAKLAGIYKKAIQFRALFPRGAIFEVTLKATDTFFYLVCGAGLFFSAISLLFSKRSGEQTPIYIMIFILPLFTLIFYRNAFPYYYPLILATVSLSAGYFWYFIESRVKFGYFLWVPVIIALIFTDNVYRNGIERSLVYDFKHQKQVVAVVHQMFPEPVTYIDGSSMIASFPKAGFFMSTWGMENYIERNEPLISRTIKAEQPKFVLANTSTSVFKKAFEHRTGLIAEDVETLRGNYVHHWGVIYIAGKEITLRANESTGVEIFIPGPYTLESLMPVKIDDVIVEPGEVVWLETSNLAISALNEPADLTLRYGSNIYRPEFEPLHKEAYRGF